MRLGLVTDIHEDTAHLGRALAVFAEQHVDRIILIGDVFRMGELIGPTVELLNAARVEGVWGNHDYGLCVDPHPEIAAKYGRPVIEFMSRLKPRLEVEGCLFTHVEPWLNPEVLFDLWYFGGLPETPEAMDKSFNAVGHRRIFCGHHHRWKVAAPGQILDWAGQRPLSLAGLPRAIVFVHAVCEGWCAIYDVAEDLLTPISVRRKRAR